MSWQNPAMLQPVRLNKEGRSHSAVSTLGRTAGVASTTQHLQAPGSFSVDIKSTIIPRSDSGRPDTPTNISFQSIRRERLEDEELTERRQAEYRDQIEKELKIKTGSENLLEALNTKNAKQARDQRIRVESELNTSNKKIAQLRLNLAAEIEKAKDTSQPRLSQLFHNPPVRSPIQLVEDSPLDSVEAESPTIVLTELLQALEAEGLSSDYYVERANSLTDLFKRNPTLKYDLVWSIFGLRMQFLLLNDTREVVASAYRVLRHVITDRKSLSIIRSLQTDYLVILSLVKSGKASLEREQALKFVRAFLDVKEGSHELSRGVIRVVASIAQNSDDELRSISILTLSEILIRDPMLANSVGAVKILSEAFSEHDYHSSGGLADAFMYLADVPDRRKYLLSGYELDNVFTPFTDGTNTATEDSLRASAKSISPLLKSWPGLFLMARRDFSAIRSLLESLYMSSSLARDVVLELLFDVLRIKNPSWSSSFLAGRRLTTYGRVGALTEDSAPRAYGINSTGDALMDHFTAAVLSALVHSGFIPAILYAIETETTAHIKRKATLLLSEALNLSYRLLPNAWSQDLQILPSLFHVATMLGDDDRGNASGAIYQIDSINRTLLRTTRMLSTNVSSSETVARSNRTYSDAARGDMTPQIDGEHFRAAINESGVLSTVNFAKWRWDIIQKLIDGPLLNPKRLEEATKTSKFVKRILGFFRPFKYRFSEVRNTKPNQRYVRIGCALMRTLLATPEGVAYLSEHKFLRQVAECLAQVDRLSGLTSESPLFAADRLSETLSGGYFAMLGVISGTTKGIAMIERWKMINMFYHIVELKGRDDLIRFLLGNMDFSLDSHLRIILSKAMTSGSLDVKVFATRLLDKYATQLMPPDEADSATKWAIGLLITQLYDPDIEVCEVAVKILEQACSEPQSLEYVVQCQPALDHLGEIGAPLLLRFLSTSRGYHYLDELDYISQEMDDWFLGRNNAYVTLVEASLSRWSTNNQHTMNTESDGSSEGLASRSMAPPHFYRELTRTAEGCELLRRKGHFEEFLTIIRENGLEKQDPEIMLTTKGAMWAVGNIASMELSAPFLESSDAVEVIVHVAENSQVLSMRGTAFFVLGLISRSIHGQEILAQHGWDSSVDEIGHSIGICLPQSVTTLFSIAGNTEAEAKVSGEAASDIAEDDDTSSLHSALTDEDSVNTQILSLINDMNNSVLVKARASELHALKAKKAMGFHQPQVFHKVMRILEQHYFRLPVLRFVLDLFEKKVLRRIVLEESDDEEDIDDTIVGRQMTDDDDYDNDDADEG